MNLMVCAGFGRPASNAILPASHRKFRCSFRGAKWENRREFINAINSFSARGRLNCQITWTGDFNSGESLTSGESRAQDLCG